MVLNFNELQPRENEMNDDVVSAMPGGPFRLRGSEAGAPFVGHNQPPPDTYEERAMRLIEVVDRWLAERPCIENDDQAGRASDLLGALTQHEGKFRTELAARVDTETAPHQAAAQPYFDALARVHAAFDAIKPRLAAGKAAMKAKLTPWLLDKARRAKAEAARIEAEALAALQAAEDAKKAAPASVDAMVAAEAAQKRALELVKAADRAAQAPVQAKGDYGARAHGLRSTWTAVLVNQDEAYRMFRDNPEISDVLTKLGNAAVRAGARDIPGFKITEERAV